MLVLVPAAAWTATASAACRSISFERGASSALVRGVAPAEGIDCLRFGAGQGQDVQMSVRSVRDQVAFSVDGVADDRDNLRFRSTKKTYEVRVFQTMRAAAPVPYEFSLSIR
ncbi:MAG: hypothetical protein JSR41_20325 [Proteobacteria bacterium]|nr:hypothetical protein [Pseudomonadota bacterium]